MGLSFNEVQFSQFVQFLKRETLAKGALPIRKAVSVVGLQHSFDTPVWVLGEELQINDNGEIINEEERKFIWISQMINEILSSVSLEEVVPVIHLPLQTSILHRYVHVIHVNYNYVLEFRLVEILQDVMQHNFYSALVMISSVVLALHYFTLVKSSCCPILVAEGLSQTGKSTSIVVALALLGIYARLLEYYSLFV